MLHIFFGNKIATANITSTIGIIATATTSTVTITIIITTTTTFKKTILSGWKQAVTIVDFTSALTLFFRSIEESHADRCHGRWIINRATSYSLTVIIPNHGIDKNQISNECYPTSVDDACLAVLKSPLFPICCPFQSLASIKNWYITWL